MGCVTASVEIRLSPERVYSWLLESLSEPRVLAARRALGEREPCPGRILRAEPFSLVVIGEPDTDTLTGLRGISGWRTRYAIEPSGTGLSRVTVRVEYGPAAALLGLTTTAGQARNEAAARVRELLALERGASSGYESVAVTTADEREGEIMKELLKTTFENASLPEGISAETENHGFEGGGLRTGAVTDLEMPLPGHGWGTLRLEVEVEPAPGKELIVAFSGDRFSISVQAAEDPAGYRARHRITHGDHSYLASCPGEVPDGPGPRLLAFEFGSDFFRGFLDGKEVISASAPAGRAPFSGSAAVQFWGEALVRSLRLAAGGPRSEPLFVVPPKKDDDFMLEVNVDFFDDLVHAPFTPAMFDDLFAEFESWGVKRCHWIYYGGTRHGWWRHTPSGVDRHAAETVAASGEIFPAAVKAAHARGIELYGLVKPFDMGFWYSLPPGSPEAAEKGKTGRIGGPKYWIADFAARRPDLLMARRPGAFGSPLNKTVQCVELVKEDDRPCDFDPGRIEIFTSPDNAAWKKYAGPVRVEETVGEVDTREPGPSGPRPTGRRERRRVIRFSGLETGDPFLALRVPGRRRSFINSPADMVRVHGERGEETMLTFGVLARSVPGDARPGDGENPFPAGIEFDVVPGTPTAVFPGYDAIGGDFALDGGDGLLAVALGKDPVPVACLSPHFEEARSWWLEWLGDCLEAGADGIELRIRNHHSPFAWGEYGFEAPVAAEFRRRHGLDILGADDFDREAWRRLRGEAYTLFCRQARALADRHGKRLGLHVSRTMDMPPAEGGMMNIHWDWRAWLEEGLADSVTLKEVHPGTRFEREVMSVARARGVKGIFCPYANNLWNTPGGEETVRGFIRSAREAGLDGYQFYECAAVVRGKSDGTLEMTRPALAGVFREEFR